MLCINLTWQSLENFNFLVWNEIPGNPPLEPRRPLLTEMWNCSRKNSHVCLRHQPTWPDVCTAMLDGKASRSSNSPSAANNSQIIHVSLIFLLGSPFPEHHRDSGKAKFDRCTCMAGLGETYSHAATVHTLISRHLSRTGVWESGLHKQTGSSSLKIYPGPTERRTYEMKVIRFLQY